MRELQPCGTNAAYNRHLRHGDDPCEDCLDAHAEYKRAWQWGEIPARELPPCGTRQAYQRHCRLNEPSDLACRAANTAYQRARR